MMMEKKALFVATTAKGHLNVFHIPYIRMLKEQGYQVDALQIAGQAVPIAVISVVVGVLWGLLFDVAMKRRYGTKGGLRR